MGYLHLSVLNKYTSFALQSYLQYVNEMAAKVDMQELSVHLYILYSW